MRWFLVDPGAKVRQKAAAKGLRASGRRQAGLIAMQRRVLKNRSIINALIGAGRRIGRKS
jgi:hypothetical protein